MDNADELVARYLAAFNETNAAERTALVDSLYSGESTYTDPHVHAQGPGEIGAFIEQTQERFPGYTFKLGSPVDAHHDQARFQWHAGRPRTPTGSSDST